MESKWHQYYKNALPAAAMVATGLSGVGLNIIFKAAAMKGMSYFVFLAYTYLFNTLLLLPVPLFLCSRNTVPLFKFPLISRLCANAVIGFCAQFMGYKGIKLSSPTMASVMSNLIPAWTFIFAVIFRMEKLSLKSSITQSKIMGTILSVIGALVAVLYSGPAILQAQSKPLISITSHHQTVAETSQNRVLGGTLLAAQHILYSFTFIIQTQMMKICPSALLLTFFGFLGVTMLSPFCFIAERDLDAWRLKPATTLSLAALLYSGIFGGAAIGVIHLWCLNIKGPVYVATFLPFSIAIAAVLGFFLLGDALHLGSVIGGVIMAAGVYAVIWGQAKEEKLRDRSLAPLSNSNSDKVEDNLTLEVVTRGETNPRTNDNRNTL